MVKMDVYGKGKTVTPKVIDYYLDAQPSCVIVKIDKSLDGTRNERRTDKVQRETYKCRSINRSLHTDRTPEKLCRHVHRSV